MEFAQALKALGVRPITGAEMTLEDGSHLTLLCEDRGGLPQPLPADHRGARGHARGPRSRCRRAVPPAARGAPRRGPRLPVRLRPPRRAGAGGRARRHAEAPRRARLLRIFGPDRLRIELQRPFARNDRRRNRLLAELAERLGVPTVATGNVHAHARERAPLQDALVAVRLGRTLDECEPQRRGNSSHALAPPEAMAARFAEHPEAVEESGRLAERLRFDLTSDLGYRYPGSEDPEADRKLAEVCAHAPGRALPAGPAPAGGRRARLEEELRVIRHLDLSGFFLLHRDMLELAREVAREVRGPDSVRALLPPGRGRGSSVASIVCYLTGLSHIDPLENELHLGRFLNEDLTALPDIDLDFPRDIREVLIPRVHERYGHERSALVAVSPPTRCAPRCATSPRRSGCRRARSSGWRARSTRGAGRHRRRRRRVGARRALAALAGARWLVREAPGLPRHHPSTPAAWSSPPSR